MTSHALPAPRRIARPEHRLRKWARNLLTPQHTALTRITHRAGRPKPTRDVQAVLDQLEAFLTQHQAATAHIRSLTHQPRPTKDNQR